MSAAMPMAAEHLSTAAGNCLSVDSEPLMFGSMVSNKQWASDSQRKAGLGLYRFYGNAAIDPKPVILNTDFQIESGAYAHGSYYIVSTYNADEDNGLYGHFVDYDLELDAYNQTTPITNCYNFAGSLAYNPADKKMYGFFANEWTDSNTEFRCLDASTATSTAIRSYFDDYITMSALAFDRNGQGYALDVKGDLYRIDTTNGALTMVGFTGVTPRYSQSMVFDYRTGRLYWYASAADNTIRLYEIDPATAKATAVSANTPMHMLGVFIENPTNDTPDQVTDLAYIASDGARRSGTLSFRMPEQTFGGAAISGMMNVRVAIEGVDTLMAMNKAAGEAVSLQLPALPDGVARIAVTAANDYGYGLASRVTTRVGIDKPREAANVRLTANGSTATLTWDAPEAGVDGGYLGSVSYRVTRNDGVVVADQITSTSLAEVAAGTYSLTSCKVTVCNEAGESAAVESNYVILGDAMALPLKESFDGGVSQYEWCQTGAKCWAVSAQGSSPSASDVDGTGGLISFCCYSTNVPKGSVSMLVSPALRPASGQAAYLNFSMYHYGGTFTTDDTLTPCIIAADGTVTELGEPLKRDNGGAEGWRRYSYPFTGGDVVCVALKCTSDYGYNIHVDNITVTDQADSVQTIVADDAEVTVYDLSGRRVAERIQRADVDRLAPGCYILRSHSATEKVVVR